MNRGITRIATNHEKAHCMKKYRALIYAILVSFALLLTLIASLLLQLRTSRANEREMSKRLYQSIRNERLK